MRKKAGRVLGLLKVLWFVSGLGGQAMEGMEQVLKSKHSPLMSGQLAASIQRLGASEEAAAEEAGLFLRLRDLDSMTTALRCVSLQLCVHF